MLETIKLETIKPETINLETIKLETIKLETIKRVPRAAIVAGSFNQSSGFPSAKILLLSLLRKMAQYGKSSPNSKRVVETR